MYRSLKYLVVCLLVPILTNAQDKNLKEVTVESIFEERAFSPKTLRGVNWMRDGSYYTSLQHDGDSSLIVKYDIVKGIAVDTLLNTVDLINNNSEIKEFGLKSYSFSSSEDYLLLTTEVEKIYRYSTKAKYYLYHLESKELRLLADGDKISYPTFSPDGDQIAYVKNNNLYYSNTSNFKEFQITNDGEFNKIINGATDWVYEEEFTIYKAFFWSPDSKKIAYLRTNESRVRNYEMQIWGGLYPKDYTFKYPKAGEDNSILEVKIYDLKSKENKVINVGESLDVYIPRIYWTRTENILSIIKLNRLQNNLDVIHANVESGQVRTVLTESTDTYVDIDFNDNITYLKGNSFIMTSEKNGYKHFYHYNNKGELIRQITKGNWEVSNVVAIDEGRKKIYFTSTESSPLERDLYVINFNGRNKRKLSKETGTSAINMSPDYKYYINYFSSNETPLTIGLYSNQGVLVRDIESNQELKQTLSGYKLGTKEFFSFNTNEKTALNGYIVYPHDFDKTKKYPVLMYVYGGPGSQNVLNEYPSARQRWFNVIANMGYIVACVDNRGTGGRGREFKHSTYKHLGKLETEDQINAAKYLANFPFVDKSRIGIWGWSYGGYMSSLCLFLGNDVFKTAIAVAPVSNWRFYDTIYTERFLQRPQDNPEGYDEYSPMFHTDKLKGNYLLIHGTGDDNVHFQNAVELVNELVKSNKQFDSFYYPNRNHGIYGGNTSRHLYQMMTDFIKNKL